MRKHWTVAAVIIAVVLSLTTTAFGATIAPTFQPVPKPGVTQPVKGPGTVAPGKSVSPALKAALQKMKAGHAFARILITRM